MKKSLAKAVISIISAATVLFTSACTTTGPLPEELRRDYMGVDTDSFNRISYDASAEYEEALKKYNEGCESIRIIHDDESLGDRKIALVIQGTSDRELVEEATKLLEKYDYKAGFTFTGIDAAEDDYTVSLVSEKGHEVIDNGLYGDLAMEEKSDEEFIYNLTASRKIFSTLFDIAPGFLMFNSTYYTGGICMAAKACGYDRIISPGAGSFLNGSSFKDLKNTREYVKRLTPGKIIVFKLKGYIDTVELAPKVEAQPPAIDKMPTDPTQDSEETPEENRSIKTLSWLLESLSAEGFKTVGLDRFRSMTEEEYVDYILEESSDLSAPVYESIETMENLTGLSFSGLPSEAADAEELITLLKDKDAKATFFVTGEELEKYPESASALSGAGFSFATRGSTGRNLNGKDVHEDYEEINLGIRALQKGLAVRPKYYMPSGAIDDNILKAAAATGLSLIKPRRPAMAVKGKISCIYFDATYNLKDVEKYLAGANKNNLRVVDITSLISAEDQVPEIDPGKIAELREANKGKKARKSDFIYTAEKAMSLIFYGVSNKAVTDDVLGILKKNRYKATFFVTLDELRTCKEQIKDILEGGHEIGLAYIDKGDKKTAPDTQENPDYAELKSTLFYDVAYSILMAGEYTAWKYDTEIKLVFQPYGDIREETMEAVSACGCNLAGYEYSLVQSKYVDAEDVRFYSSLSSKINAHRGTVAYFNINYFNADKELTEDNAETLCGRLLTKYISGKIKSLTYTDVYGQLQSSTSYKVKTYSSLLRSPQRYSVRRAAGNVSDSNLILGSMSSAQEQNAYMVSRYIGNPNTTVIPGFTEADMKKFDTTGKVKAGKVLFLTFDDWGLEKDINELLYVLDKYQVKGNFFVRTNNVSANPNLLRAIAVSGHMIGSHSDSHFVGWHDSQDEEGNYHFDSLTDEEAAAFRKDIVKSYATLYKYCGDVNIDGKPSVSTIYRPPMLAVSRISMYQLFDVGYSYIVCGNFSSHDYEAGSVDELAGKLRNGVSQWYGMETVSDGSVLIMHMSSNAQYTAEALDIMIPEWQAAGFTIARLDDFLR